MSGGNGILVAGIGNIFQNDDGFGSEVARLLLAGPPLPDGVNVVDYGIRGVHLAYDLLDGYDAAILVDATARGGEPGTIYVIEPDVDAIESETGLAEAGIVDAHGMDPASVLALVRSLGGHMDRLLVVGCEPADVEDGMGLSEPVAGAVEEACRVVRDLVDREVSRLQSTRKETIA
ncbi:MAG TPA: hydrogenase maturation protease [Acidimicrobiia bacterium]|nr:hydrogenase maturation protease [Acidimicrobiia bacterium]HKN90293.1 hydrogenase maturation protease [Acidimicrobiia bacterium]